MKALALLVALLCQAAVLPALGGKENAYIPAEIDPELMPRVGMAPFIAIPQRPLIQAEAQAVRILIGQTIAESGFFLVEPNEYTDELFSRDNIPVTEIYRPEYIEKLRMSALNFVIAGSLELISGHYLVTVRVLDLERRVFGAQASELLPAEGRELRRGLRRLIPRFVKQIDTGGYKVRYPENSSYNLEYEIGQTGPAGGIIFFKKATAKDGWRYLEVAPPSAEFLAPWGFHDHGFYGPDGLSTENGIGAGKVNTATIVARMLSYRRVGCAAQFVQALTTGGVQDWYLPSLEEMEQVWLIVGAKGKGRFSAEPYWTSSQSDHPYAWFFDFRGGKQYYNGLKSTVMRVRAIRAF